MITVEQLSLQQGAFALRDVSFTVPTGRYAVLMGQTGSGKTTVLEAICGLRRITGGRIRLAERDVTREKPGARKLGYVPQDGALFASMRVRDNLGFPLSLRKWDKTAITGRVTELAELLGISHLLDRSPGGLSGGEAQRVALGRALAARPPVLLLDEPLSALDEETREGMYTLLESMQEHTHVSVLHVTHNTADADRLADMVLHFHDGKITA